MASGYFGFTAGGTQYSTPAGTYQTVPTAAAYVPQTQAYTATAVSARPAYEAYQTASNTAYYATPGASVVAAGQAVAAGRAYNYAYATPATVNTYDPKNYYTNSSYANTGNGLIATTPPSVWSDGSGATSAAAQKNSLAAYGYVAAGSSGPNQAYGTPTSAAAAMNAKNSYDAALYSAATSLYHQQSGGAWPHQHQGKPRNVFPNAAKKKGPPSIRTQQLYYCETCKISCAGPQTYREHLEGQRHKKKAAAAATTTKDKVSVPLTKAHNVLRCELCDVTCTGADAYQAHLRGTKHQKVVKLHQKLGKPIPPSEPTMIGTPGAGAPAVNKPAPPAANNGTPPKPKVLATPRINFVGAGVLKTLSGEEDLEGERCLEANTAPAAYPLTASEIASITSAAAAAADASNGVVATEETVRNAFDALPDKEVAPVGHEYVEEIRNEVGKVISFHCKLCECKFNDPNAKEMHLKGRRHRLQYKKKVDPNLEVEIKANLRNRRSAFDEKMRRQKEALWRQREKDERWREEMNARMMTQNSIMSPQSLFGGGRRPETSDDRHVMSKHATIYPNEDELQAVQEVVSAAEKSLKLASDQLLMPIVKSEALPPPEVEQDEAAIAAAAAAIKEPERILKGVQRVGPLAKGLLLRGDRDVELVVSCSVKPTVTLLSQIYQMLPEKLAEFAPKKFDLEMTHDCIYVVRPEEPKVRVAVCLTSPLMREANTPEEQKEALDNDPTDLLDRHKCLQALAAVRHAKWFQAKASGLHSCVIVIRIFREMQTRSAIWSALSPWALELLVEKCIESGGPSMSPGDGFRRVLEAVASGLLYEEMSGLFDPCEKDATDALAGLTTQQREDITYDAQHCLRLIAFRQVYRVLNIDQLPAVNRYPSRKRRLSSDNTNGSASVDGKKDKKEDDGSATEAFASANLTNTFVVAS